MIKFQNIKKMMGILYKFLRQLVEPVYFYPIIPMVLVNGSEGIGTGWSTFLPNYNPKEIV